MLWLMGHPNLLLGLLFVAMPAALLLAVWLTVVLVVLPFAVVFM